MADDKKTKAARRPAAPPSDSRSPSPKAEKVAAAKKAIAG